MRKKFKDLKEGDRFQFGCEIFIKKAVSPGVNCIDEKLKDLHYIHKEVEVTVILQD